MVSSVANPVELDDTVTSKLSPGKLLAENEKVQDDLAFKLRNLIANFCDEHFVKYLKEKKEAALQICKRPIASLCKSIAVQEPRTLSIHNEN